MKNAIAVVGLAVSGLLVGLREYLTRRPETYVPVVDALSGRRR